MEKKYYVVIVYRPSGNEIPSDFPTRLLSNGTRADVVYMTDDEEEASLCATFWGGFVDEDWENWA